MKKNSLMTHVVAGYPSMKECEQIILTMSEAGVSYIEIQIPFSDPIADGPTIMAANQKAIENGIAPNDCFLLIDRIKNKISTPIIIMTYFNIPFRYGLDKFCKRAKESGVYGLIIPDVNLDEEKYEHYIATCEKYNLHAIQIISPITTDQRLKKISKIASGFVYCVATLGTTGERSNINPQLQAYIQNVKKHIKLPIALGFGISSKEQVNQALKHADIAVIGSKIINLCNENKSNHLPVIKEFLSKCF